MADVRRWNHLRVRAWLRETTTDPPASFWYAWAGDLVNRAGSFALILLAFYLTDARGLSPATAGLVIGGYGAGAAVGAVLGGLLTDRLGRRRTLVSSLVLTAVTLLLLGLMRHPVAVAVVVCVYGMANNLSRPAFGAVMVDVVPAEHRVRAFSLVHWAGNLGVALASLLAGLVASVDYLLLFVIDAASCLLTAILVLAKLPETRPAAPNAVPAVARPRVGLRTVLADRVFLGFAGLTLLGGLVIRQFASSLPIDMRQHGLSASAYGTVMALNCVLIVAGQLFVPRLVGRRDSSYVLAAAAVVVGVGFGLAAFASSLPLYAISVLVWTMGEMLQAPSVSALLAGLSPDSARGRYQGVFALAGAGAGFLAPVLGGLVLDRYGSAALWLGCFGLGVLVALGHLAAGPARRRRLRSPAQLPTDS